MSSFEFLSVLISVVVGLAIANMLNGIGRLIYRFKELKMSASFAAWTVFLFLYLVIYWWTVVFGWQEWQNWNLLIFLFVLTYGVVLFLLSVVLFPAELPATWDPGEHLIEMRRWFFSIFAVLIVVEVMDSWLKDHLVQFSIPYVALIMTWSVAAVVGWTNRNRTVHALLAVAALVAQVTWVAYQLGDLEWSLGS